MLRRSSHNFVCWRCLRVRAAPSATAAPLSPAVRCASSTCSPLASALRLPVGIRERLRQWAAENPAPGLAVPSDEPADGHIANTFTKSSSELLARLRLSAQDEDAARPHFDGTDVVDLGLSGSVLQPGDLVEVSSGSSRLRLLAVCLGRFNGHLHFYTNTGKWFTSRSIRPAFVVRNFVQDPADLQVVIDAIPSTSSSSAVLDELQDLNIGPSRDLAGSLLRRMLTFQSAARLIHQTHVERLSRAHATLGHDEKLLSLREIADELLPASLKRGQPNFPPEALYAVYSVLGDNDIAFRALDRGPRHHESSLFFLQSAAVQANVYHVEELVREYYEFTSGHRSSTSRAAAFGHFLDEARALIDQSRGQRKPCPHAMIGPYETSHAQTPALRIPTWSETGLAVIKFIHHWAASGGHRPDSRCHWIGASILRCLRRYDDALLDDATGWTFLQEIGWIPPWDLSARHSQRLPGLLLDRHPGLVPAPAPDATPAALVPDALAHLRQDFGQSTVYCIDSAHTLDVDDGISLEETGDGDYWIHVHIADPASRVTPGSQLAEQAALRVQTSYVPGFYQRMFDDDLVRDSFSLAPNRPSLAFSARVTEHGRLIDYKVTPGIIRNVVYLTPEDAVSVCGDTSLPPPAPPDVFEVGTPPSKSTPGRRMATPGDLSRKQQKELNMLSKLAKALHHVHVDKGAVPIFPPRPNVEVSLDEVTPSTTSENSVYYRGDPYIRILYDNGGGGAFVAPLMQLAGEVGARWCLERNIPIPYRVQLMTDESLQQLRAFTRNVYFPKLVAGEMPSDEDQRTYSDLIGGFDISTVPSPYFTLGKDLYTKVTSPLRRYPDLLVHWQIEAALLEEHRRGQSLAVGKSPGEAGASGGSEQAPPHAPTKKKAKKNALDFLPFSKRQLDETILPRLRIRERYANRLDRVDGKTQWMLQALVRAWHFGEGPSRLPSTFRFTVSDVNLKRAVFGRIDWFDRLAVVELEDMNNVVRVSDMKIGDVFRAELVRVNVHAYRINVRLLEKLG